MHAPTARPRLPGGYASSPVPYHSPRAASLACPAKGRGGGASSSSSPMGSAPPKLVTVSPDASDAWRLDPIIDLLRAGGVGVIPTDTLPALVVDVAARDAAARLCAAKGGPPKVRALALLCRGWADVDAFTTGFPAPPPGVPDPFRTARAALPGPYTLILGAGKALPKAASLAELGKKKGGAASARAGGRRRATVGVRLPGHPVAKAVLSALDRPLLCTSVRPDAGRDDASDFLASVDEEEGGGGGGGRGPLAPRAAVGWSPGEAGAALADRLAGRGVAFVVDCGPRPPIPDVSTVLDFSGGWPPVLVRAGAGEPAVFGVEVEEEAFA